MGLNMFRRKINKVRRQFAYEGQEDSNVLDRVDYILVKGNLIPPFNVEVYQLDDEGNIKKTVWSGISYFVSYTSTIDDIVEIENGELMFPYHPENTTATRDGVRVRVN